MPAVAAYKWVNDLPIEDPEREAQVLAAATDAGLRWNLRVEAVTELFLAQINAAKEIQRYWFERWSNGAAVPEVLDLSSELRPRIIVLGDAILAAAAEHPGVHPEIPDIPGLSPETSQALAQSYAALRRYPNRLRQILDSGVLRVGTTGDYAPFSVRQGEGEFAGIDIELAKDLARSLNAELALVATTWPQLLTDFDAGRFDIAMSGVSRTLDRQRSGFFSIAYYVGGKTAIGRCEDADRFDSLSKVDRSGIRVIVNPGGTNERFVDANVKQADKVLHPDNRTIFDELVAGRADVMFTDAIEVELQTRRTPALCRVIAETLSYQEKGYLMPADTHLQRYVDLWLSQRLADGTVAETFATHGVRHRR